jgi:uncharacterized protein YbjT (DUF2867 family)
MFRRPTPHGTAVDGRVLTAERQQLGGLAEKEIMILVTGATGTVGSQVVQELLEKGARFFAGVHSRPLDIEGVESRTIDYDRPETLPPALEGVRTVYLVSYETLHEKAMVAAARDAGVERIVKQSAWRAADEGFIVGRSHREVERAIEGSGMAWTFLRPNMFMQNLMTVHGESIRRENVLYESAEDARVSYIDARRPRTLLVGRVLS